MGEFSMDLVEEILLRLEVKHILRCKLVSKNVYRLIMSPRFVSAHLHGSKYNKRRIAVLEHNFSTLFTDPLYLLSPQSHGLVPSLVRSGNTVSLMGSCNGLLCIMTRKHQTLLFNPATREYRELPVREYCHGCDEFGFGFGFGFGYDAISGDYKVVKICRCRRPFAVHVWSVATNKWTEIPSALPNLLNGYNINDSSVFIRGNLYWKARPRSSSDSRADILFSFSLVDCTFRQIPMPHGIVHSTCLTEYMGHLGMFYGGRSPFFYDLWVMEDNADGKISWDKRLSNMGPFLASTWPTKVCVNGEFVMQNPRDDKGFLYNPRSKEIKELLFTEFRWSCSIKLWSLEESLVSP